MTRANTLILPSDQNRISNTDAVMDVIGDALGQGAEWVVIPVDRLPEGFFQLRTGIAGELVQKFVNYRLGLAVVGDMSVEVGASSSLRDFVYESDRGRQLWFLDSLDAFHERMGV